MKEVKKKWGRELWIVNEPEYCGKLLTVQPGHSCSLHFHKNKKETFYVLYGQLKLNILDLKTATGKTTVLKQGEAFTLLPLTPHTFSTADKRPCQFLEVSTHHEDSDSYRITRSE
jgi:N-acetylneuraminate synthase